MPHTKKFLANQIKHAVIDVGSNSVRLVIYHVYDGAIVPIHNEKTLAALGKGLAQSGDLSIEGVEMALGALKRYRVLLNALNIKNIDAIATAAIREARDGEEFVKRVSREIGIRIRVLSGEDEGRYSALGVEFGAPNSSGFMGDLGGSSLELVNINPNGAATRESFQLGPLALGELALSKNMIESKEIARTRIQEILETSKVLKTIDSRHFHAVGGAWRSLAHIHIVYRNYPLHVLHNYRMNRNDALQICDFISSQSKKSLERISGVSARRVETLPYAALLMHEIINIASCDEIIVSSYGLREGILVERYGFGNSKSGPLIDSAIAHAGIDKNGLEYANSLNEWLKPALDFAQESIPTEINKKLIYALCILSNIGINYHPDHRAFLSYQLLLRAPFAAIFHHERVFIARAIAARYGAKQDYLDTLSGSEIISNTAKQYAEKIGLAIRLASNMSANSAQLLKQTRLEFLNNEIVLNISTAVASIYSQQVQRRHQQFASSLGLSTRLNTQV